MFMLVTRRWVCSGCSTRRVYSGLLNSLTVSSVVSRRGWGWRWESGLPAEGVDWADGACPGCLMCRIRTHSQFVRLCLVCFVFFFGNPDFSGDCDPNPSFVFCPWVFACCFNPLGFGYEMVSYVFSNPSALMLSGSFAGPSPNFGGCANC